MSGRGSRLYAAQLLCAAAATAFASPAFSQAAQQPAPAPQPPPDAAELDPNAPLAPLPDLGVPWPDLKPSETAPAAVTTTVKGKKQTQAIAGDTGAIRYVVQGDRAAVTLRDSVQADHRIGSWAVHQFELVDPVGFQS